MLATLHVHPTLPTADVERARAFYEGTLGFSPRTVAPGGIVYGSGGDTMFVVYPSRGSASGSHTQMSFSVTDIASVVAGLKADGVTFGTYDFEGFDKTTSIAQAGPNRIAWFKDPDGNTIGLIEWGSEPG